MNCTFLCCMTKEAVFEEGIIVCGAVMTVFDACAQEGKIFFLFFKFAAAF